MRIGWDFRLPASIDSVVFSDSLSSNDPETACDSSDVIGIWVIEGTTVTYNHRPEKQIVFRSRLLFNIDATPASEKQHD